MGRLWLDASDNSMVRLMAPLWSLGFAVVVLEAWCQLAPLSSQLWAVLANHKAWGDKYNGGDTSLVDSQLTGVKQIFGCGTFSQDNTGGFAALRLGTEHLSSCEDSEFC